MNIGIDGWISVLKLCSSGQCYVAPDLLLSGEETGREKDTEPQSCLTRHTLREREVLALVADGCQNKEIAARLELSENTIKLHIRNIISKLGVHNRTEAALIHVQTYGT